MTSCRGALRRAADAGGVGEAAASNRGEWKWGNLASIVCRCGRSGLIMAQLSACRPQRKARESGEYLWDAKRDTQHYAMARRVRSRECITGKIANVEAK